MSLAEKYPMEPQPIQFGAQLRVALPHGLKTKMNVAASQRGMRLSEWLRMVVRERLEETFNGPGDPPLATA